MCAGVREEGQQAKTLFGKNQCQKKLKKKEKIPKIKHIS
jgi:hypothetical protein